MLLTSTKLPSASDLRYSARRWGVDDSSTNYRKKTDKESLWKKILETRAFREETTVDAILQSDAEREQRFPRWVDEPKPEPELPSASFLRQQAVALGIDISNVNFRIKEQKNRLSLQIQLKKNPQPSECKEPMTEAEELQMLRTENLRLKEELALANAELEQVRGKRQKQRDKGKQRQQIANDRYTYQENLRKVTLQLTPAIEQKYSDKRLTTTFCKTEMKRLQLMTTEAGYSDKIDFGVSDVDQRHCQLVVEYNYLREQMPETLKFSMFAMSKLAYAKTSRAYGFPENICEILDRDTNDVTAKEITEVKFFLDERYRNTDVDEKLSNETDVRANLNKLFNEGSEQT